MSGADWWAVGWTAGWTLLWVVLLARSVHRDPRRLRNGFLLMAAVYTGAGLAGQLLTLLLGGPDVVGWVTLALMLVLGAGLAVLPLALVANGLTMVRRERRSLGNLLSLLLGLGMLALPVLAVLLVRTDAPVGGAVVVGLALAVGWVAFCFLGFVAQTLLYRRTARRVDAHAVVVLGSRLVGGQVPPLLASRLRTSVAEARRLGTAERPVPVVPSGGQGPDEPEPEGVAMGRWLKEHGVPDDLVLVEDRARTTRENLRLSVELLQRHGVPGPYLVATNDYHAPRAALEAMDLGLAVHAVGGRTALYYLPSAFLREFVAVLRRRPRIHAVVAGLIVALSALLLVVLAR